MRVLFVLVCLFGLRPLGWAQGMYPSVGASDSVERYMEVGLMVSAGDLAMEWRNRGASRVYDIQFAGTSAYIAWISESKSLNKQVVLRLNAYSAWYKESYNDSLGANSFDMWVKGIQVYTQVDEDYYTIGVGLHVGSLQNIRFEFENSDNDNPKPPLRASWGAYVLPSLYLRAGTEDLIYVDIELMQPKWGLSPGNFVRVGGGTTLGNKRKWLLHGGYSTPHFYYMGLRIPFNHLKLNFAFFIPDFTMDKKGNQLEFSMIYRIPSKL